MCCGCILTYDTTLILFFFGHNTSTVVSSIRINRDGRHHSPMWGHEALGLRNKISIDWDWLPLWRNIYRLINGRRRATEPNLQRFRDAVVNWSPSDDNKIEFTMPQRTICHPCHCNLKNGRLKVTWKRYIPMADHGDITRTLLLCRGLLTGKAGRWPLESHHHVLVSKIRVTSISLFWPEVIKDLTGDSNRE